MPELRYKVYRHRHFRRRPESSEFISNALGVAVVLRQRYSELTASSGLRRNDGLVVRN